MAIDVHTLSLVKGTKLLRQDRVILGAQFGVANAAGSGAGAAVTTTLTFAGSLPANYAVAIDPHQDATWYTNNRTANGFDVVITPRLAASTLAAGTFDVHLLA